MKTNRKKKMENIAEAMRYLAYVRIPYLHDTLSKGNQFERETITKTNEKTMKNYLIKVKKIIACYRKRRDDKFRERIDRVYFRHDGDGLRYMEGHLVMVRDEKSGRNGNLVTGDYLTYSDALSTKNYSEPQAERGKIDPEIQEH